MYRVLKPRNPLETQYFNPLDSLRVICYDPNRKGNSPGGATMKSVCAWCEAEGKISAQEFYDRGEPVTHSICDEHKDTLLRSVKPVKEGGRMLPSITPTTKDTMQDEFNKAVDDEANRILRQYFGKGYSDMTRNQQWGHDGLKAELYLNLE